MNVHIVCSVGEDRIIGRLAHALARETGWTLSAEPDPDADLNHFVPYLDYADFDATPTAAWFTHRDDPMPSKSEKWRRVAAAVDLRLTSAPIYLPELEAQGRAGLVTPPLDRAKFKPAARKRAASRPVIGFSGYVYDSGRKGEGLAAAVQQRFSQKAEVRASGQGWTGVPTQHYSWADMQKFYQGLDVYVCTSLIEGVPYPPLEALACGVKIVIPRGVGLLDTLPVMDGIVRYPAGDEAGLIEAIETALETNADPLALRAATERFTLAAWVQEHVEAFTALLTPFPAEAELPAWQGRAGIYIVAFGDPARDCAQRLIASAQTHMPDVPTCLVSDRPLGGETVFVEETDYDIGARRAKLKIAELAPAEWDYVLYLDADTELVAPVSFLFDALQDGWELVICTNPTKYASTRMMIRPDNREEVEKTWNEIGFDDFLQLNGGVFGFRRNARTTAFFARWVEQWMQYAKRDQAALLRSLYADPLRTLLLTNVWNSMDEYCDPALSAGILHHQREARRAAGIIDARGDSPEAWQKIGGKS